MVALLSVFSATILLSVHMDLGLKLLSQPLPDRFLNKIYDPKLI